MKNGKRLTCAGDEPYNPGCRTYVEGSDWLLHEAFCLYGDRERFQPYEKHHSTVKEACELATELNIPNLVLWHTEDKQIARRILCVHPYSRPAQYRQGPALGIR